MIINASAYWGHWPFRNLCGNTLTAIAEAAKKNDITHMMIASLNAVFYKDTQKGNLELYRALRDYSKSVEFIPFAVINPIYPAWEEDLEEAVNKLGFRGIELCPKYHGYNLDGMQEGYQVINPAEDAARLAAKYNIPIRLNAGFENFRQRHLMDVKMDTFNALQLTRFLKNCPDTTVIINGATPSDMGDELHELVKKRNNVFFDITRLDSFMQQTMEDTVLCIGDSHMCFGSLSPFQYIQSNLAKVYFTKSLNKQRVLFENLKALINY